MSTFNGIVAEFPQIRIDYFRPHPDRRPPLACFLSHVHSDHLAGLESLRAPFVYCSAATREILLRLEKYHYRVNFARGILESRTVTYDKSMHKLAKPLPLETPTVIELDPKNKIRVTLFDANHCVGAVMFLIEADGKAILYTGDVRAETWWVNSLVQNPVLLPYTLGAKRLDCMYLDTTFATKSEPYREFPSKAEGIRELLQKVQEYPHDTKFYFHSWTFGYENVWIALSAFLDCQIHLDQYRARIYASLSALEKKHLREAGLDMQHDNKYLRNSGLQVREASALCGFRNGNHIQPGCLTSQSNTRLHSCERGMGCPVIDADTAANIVHIIPIVTRVNGTDVAEIGAGGGKGDLDQKEELETGDVADVAKLMELCAKEIQDDELRSRVLALLQTALDDKKGNIGLGTVLQKESQDSEDDLSLQTFVSVLSSHAAITESADKLKNETIRFPYSRHSSYSELCTLVEAFQPKDVYPCTVDEGCWCPTLGIRSLFGSFCSANSFRHDIEMTEMYEAKVERGRRGKRNREGESREESQTSEAKRVGATEPITPRQSERENTTNISTLDDEIEETAFHTPAESPGEARRTPIMEEQVDSPMTSPRTRSSTLHEPTPREIPPPRQPNPKKPNNRAIAYKAALGIELTWADFGGLVSTRRASETEEKEL
ncbi:hypothetical protein K505DRAFT_410456 [Melanomma pulvis-pyrius CBS 109.77]|uniref:Protein artemis n=1 Tax=Melanomma pulvis-pyrius CBS 109.77 TaxID=1314802 RepID=A0A6A6WZ28_9PLEO|nr:hypothetical protein K505DRAFT_410456 [Melanomma pulvis-pyrius CBS 109.77]